MIIIGENITIKAADIVVKIQKTDMEGDSFHTVTVNDHIIFLSAHREYAQEVYDNLVSAIIADKDVFEV